MSRKIAVLLVLCLCGAPLSLIANVVSQQTHQIQYSWSEPQYTYSFHKIWDGSSSIIDFSGSYSDVFYWNDHFYNETEDTWTRELRTIYYDANYTYFSNTTVVGEVNIDITVDVYRVDIDYGDSLQLVWIAFKNGTIVHEVDLQSYFKNYTYVEDFYEEYHSTFTKINMTTYEIIDEWTSISNNSGVKDMTPGSTPPSESQYELTTYEYSTPMCLTMQKFTTEKGDKIGWAEVFYDYIIYKDLDMDGIYSAGETTSPESSGFFLHSSDEWVGWMKPITAEWIYYTWTPGGNHTIGINFPSDKSVSEIVSTIEFTPPSLSKNTVSWDINYPGYPIWAQVADLAKPMEERYFNFGNTSYSNTSPGDFMYSFDYDIQEAEANLDFTLGLSKVSNESFYNASQGYGLSLPHYNYFLSTFDINEEDPKELTVPAELFSFESNGTTVAEISMINPVKLNYTLYDYPKIGINSEFESVGGSIHRLLNDHQNLMAHGANPYINLLYSIEDVVKLDPAFIVQDDLYRVETQNYPVWNGEKLVHDPSLTIYYAGPKTIPNGTEIDGFIPGFNVYMMLITLLSLVIVYIVKIRRKQP